MWKIKCVADEFSDERSCFMFEWFFSHQIRITLDARGPHVQIGAQDWYDDFGQVRIDKYPSHNFDYLGMHGKSAERIINEMKKGMRGIARFSSFAQYATTDFELDGFTAMYNQLVQRWSQWSNQSAPANPMSESL